MPTTNPRIFLTLGPDTLSKVDALAALWGMNRPQAIRKAIKEAAKAKLPKP